MNDRWFALVESNTTGTGRDFALAARQRGLRPVLVTASPDRYPYVAELGIDVRPARTGDVESVDAVCRELMSEGLAGITSSSEYFVHIAALVAIRLGLPTPDPAAIERCRDKVAQRDWLAARGVPVPDFAACATAAQAAETARAVGAPVVVKPVRGSGSQGVHACADPAAAGRWAAGLLSGRDTVLVERLVDGPEFSVEVLDGDVVGITRKHLCAEPHFVEIGHDFPAEVAEPIAARLATVAADAVREVGLLSGPAHVELRVSADGQPWLIEVNPRLAGGLIPRLVRYATGRDLVADVVACAVRDLPSRTTRRAGFASIRFVVPTRGGVVHDVTGVPQARVVPGVVEVRCTLRSGTEIRIEHSFADRVGHVIGIGRSAGRAIEAAERAVARIGIEYETEGDRDVGGRTTRRHDHAKGAV